jgi:hypothetical protein
MMDRLTVFHSNYRNGVYYTGEHAEIMRMVWGLDKSVKVVRMK